MKDIFSLIILIAFQFEKKTLSYNKHGYGIIVVLSVNKIAFKKEIMKTGTNGFDAVKFYNSVLMIAHA